MDPALAALIGAIVGAIIGALVTLGAVFLSYWLRERAEKRKALRRYILGDDQGLGEAYEIDTDEWE